MQVREIEKTVNVGLLGAGTVGMGVVDLLEKNAAEISQKAGIKISIKRILEKNPQLVKELTGKGYQVTEELTDILNDPEIAIVVELLGRVEPARTFMVQALEKGKHVITANKDVMAEHGHELLELAASKQVDFMFEAAVGGGIPIIRPLKQCLAANNIASIMGIVNGTTNYMLSKMSSEGLDYEEVLKEAQEKGYAEKDPTADVGGIDAARKIAILSSIAFNSQVGLEDVYIEGIQNVSANDIKYADELGYAVKLLAIAKKSQELGIDVRVHPTFLPKSHPLASVNGVFNAIFVTGDYIGEAMFYGQGAGRNATASAVCGDIIDVARDIVTNNPSRVLCTCFAKKKICPQNLVETPFYIRMLVTDQPGVLATIADAFGQNKVGLRQVVQKESIDGCAVLVLVTHNVCFENMSKALETLQNVPAVAKVYTVIRVEDGNF